MGVLLSTYNFKHTGSFNEQRVRFMNINLGGKRIFISIRNVHIGWRNQ